MTEAVTPPCGKPFAEPPKIGGRQEAAKAERAILPVATIRPSRWRRPNPVAGTPACNKYSSVRRRRTPGGVEWYGIVTMETAGCNSACPEGGEGSRLMTEDRGGREVPGHTERRRAPKSGATRTRAEHGNEGRERQLLERSSEKILTWGKGTHAGDNDTGRRAEEANSKPWGTKARRPYTKGCQAGGI